MREMDNTVFYLQEGGSELNNITYDYTQEGYTTYPNALLSNHLINDPTSISVTYAGDEFNSAYLFVVNGDGTAAIFRRIEAQEVSNWSRFEVEGDIITATSLYQQTWMVIKRSYVYEHETVNNYFLEYLEDGNPYLDGCFEVTGVSGETDVILPNFAGQDVTVLSDDGYYETQSTDEAGTIEIPENNGTVYIGLPIDFVIETMPVNSETDMGMTRNMKKRIYRTQLDMYESYGFDITYNGRTKTIGNYTADVDDISEAPQPKTDLKDIRWTGWTKQDCTVTIESSSPYAVNLRNIEVSVKFTG